jgi:hypothetical protein
MDASLPFYCTLSCSSLPLRSFSFGSSIKPSCPRVCSSNAALPGASGRVFVSAHTRPYFVSQSGKSVIYPPLHPLLFFWNHTHTMIPQCTISPVAPSHSGQGSHREWHRPPSHGPRDSRHVYRERPAGLHGWLLNAVFHIWRLCQRHRRRAPHHPWASLLGRTVDQVSSPL